MNDDFLPLLISSKPGIKRDGTQFEGDHYVDGQWVRFQRALPRKIGGYRLINGTLTGPPRELELFSSSGLTYVHSGSPSKLERLTVDSLGNSSPISDRTPAAFVANDDYDWQFAQVFDTAANVMKMFAHAAPNLVNIDNATDYTIYVGDSEDTAAFTAVPSGVTSGGILALQSYLVYFGSNGLVGWSVSNNPDDLTGLGSGVARVTDQKIIKGLPLRGGSSSPAGLLWSLNSLLRMSFIGGGPIWQFDTLSSESSILSANSVIEYDGVYYWCGVDRFLMYTGVLQELDNELNLNWFFDNVNYNYRGKVFAFKVPRYGEIWWCAPMFGATEPNYAVIFNVRESRRLGFPVWYDTVLPADGRGAAHYAQVFNRPFMTGVEELSGGSASYGLWQHETGTDEVIGTTLNAIESYFETSDVTLLTAKEPKNKSLYVEHIEPDFIQSQDLKVQVSGRANARAPQVYGDLKTFADVASLSEEQIVYLKEQRRELRFRFVSNTIGGDYQMGNNIAFVRPADGRVLG